MRQLLLTSLAILSGTLLSAEGSAQVLFDVQPRTFTTPQTLTASWTCPSGSTGATASGAWTGAKAASGTQSLTGTVGQSTYNLSCTGATGPVALSWSNPTTNTDGSAYTNPKNILVYRASTQAGLDTATPAAIDPDQQAFQYTGLPVGTHWFSVKALNLADIQSDFANKVSKAVTASTVTATPVTVTGNTKPNPPTVVTAVFAFDVKGNSGKLGDRVGAVALGTACLGTQPIVKPDYFEVLRTDVTMNPGANPRPGPIVAKCGPAGLM